MVAVLVAVLVLAGRLVAGLVLLRATIPVLDAVNVLAFIPVYLSLRI